jgi:hypothetical protein
LNIVRRSRIPARGLDADRKFAVTAART